MAINFPNSPTTGDTHTAAGVEWQYDGEKWVSQASGGGGGASVTVSDTAPASPSQGDLWWDSSDDAGVLFIWYDDADGGQWVEASGTGQDVPLWTRTGTTLSPATAGDSVAIDGSLRVRTTGDYATNPSFEVLDNGVHKTYRASSDVSAGMQVWHSDVGSVFRPRITFFANGSLALGGTDSSNTYNGRWNSSGTIEIGSDIPANGANITLSDNGTATFYRQTSTGSNSILHVQSDVNGAQSLAFYVEASGRIYARNTTITQIASERRLKENIVSIDPDTAWETIRSTPFYSYNFIGSGSVTYGPMADEVPDEMRIATDQADDVGVIHTYDNGMLQARLYVALQEALTRIEALEAKLAALEGGTN
jgi:hypothetical protein